MSALPHCQPFQQVVADRGAEIVYLKISKQDGLSRDRRIRDYRIDQRIPVVSKDTWESRDRDHRIGPVSRSVPTEVSDLFDRSDHNRDLSIGVGG